MEAVSPYSNCLASYSPSYRRCNMSVNTQHPDQQKRRDQVLCRNQAFSKQMPALSNGYLQWCLGRGGKCFREHFEKLNVDNVSSLGSEFLITIIDVFCGSLFGLLHIQLTAQGCRH